MDMTEEQQEALKSRQTWQAVFGTPKGEAVLAEMLNNLGYFSANPDMITPKLTAFANWMLAKIGIITLENLPRYIKAVVGSKSADDINTWIAEKPFDHKWEFDK